MKLKQKKSIDYQKIFDNYKKVHEKIIESILRGRMYSNEEPVPQRMNPKLYSSLIPPTNNIANHEIVNKNLIKQSSPKNLKHLAKKHAFQKVMQTVVQKSNKLTKQTKKSTKTDKTKQKRRVRDSVLGATDTRNLIFQYLDDKHLKGGETVLVLFITLYTLLFLFYFLKCMFIDIDILYYIFQQVQQPIRQATPRDKYFNVEEEKSFVRKEFEQLFRIMDEQQGKPFIEFTNEIRDMMDCVEKLLKSIEPNLTIALSQKIKVEPYWRSKENKDLEYKEKLFLRSKKKRAQTSQYPFITLVPGKKQEKSNTNQSSSSQQESRIKNYLNQLIYGVLKQMENIVSIIIDLQNLLHLIGESVPELKKIVNPSQPQMDTRLETDMYILEEGVSFIVDSLLNFSFNYEIADYCQKINE